MSSTQRYVPSAAFLLLLVATLAVIVSEHPLWPLVDYPMFARAQTRRVSDRTKIYLVDGGVETLLPPEQAIFSRDFDSVGARDVLRDLDDEGRRAFLGMVLASLRDGGHSPSALRLYRVRRSYTPDTNRPRTVERRLLVEIGARR